MRGAEKACPGLDPGPLPAFGQTTRRKNASIVQWLGYLSLKQVKWGRNPLEAPNAHVTDAGYEPAIRKRSCKWRFESSRARQFKC